MSKLMKVMLTSIIIIIFIGGIAAVIYFNFMSDKNKSDKQSIDDIVEYSFETPEITTDLEDGSFVRIQFQVVTDSKQAKKEIEKREFQVKNILIKEIATMKEEDFKSGLGNLEKALQTKLNDVMAEGKVVGVYTINKILQ